MPADKSMTDEEWNAWTDEVRTFVENEREESQSLFDQSDKRFNRLISRIEDHMEDGDDDATLRQENKEAIQKAGRQLPLWPKTGPGKDSVFAGWHNMVIDRAVEVKALAWTAFYQVLQENNMEHHLMTRASKKEGTDGAPYGTLENFLRARNTSEKAAYKAFLREGNWGTIEVGKQAPIPEGFNAETIMDWVQMPTLKPLTEESA